jgi:hypothetical protein
MHASQQRYTTKKRYYKNNLHEHFIFSGSGSKITRSYNIKEVGLQNIFLGIGDDVTRL